MHVPQAQEKWAHVQREAAPSVPRLWPAIGQSLRPYRISDAKRGLRERLVVERISLRGICRAVGVTRKGLLGLLVQCVEALPAHRHVQPITCQQFPVTLLCGDNRTPMSLAILWRCW